MTIQQAYQKMVDRPAHSFRVIEMTGVAVIYFYDYYGVKDKSHSRAGSLQVFDRYGTGEKIFGIHAGCMQDAVEAYNKFLRNTRKH